jgi:hypothetical protein
MNLLFSVASLCVSLEKSIIGQSQIGLNSVWTTIYESTENKLAFPLCYEVSFLCSFSVSEWETKRCLSLFSIAFHMLYLSITLFSMQLPFFHRKGQKTRPTLF